MTILTQRKDLLALGASLVLAPLQMTQALDAGTALEAHNAVRNTVNQSGYADQPRPDPPLSLMTWDDTLAEAAQRYSERCLWQHSDNRGHTGENLYASSDPSASISEAVQAWAAEHVDYAFSTSTCSSNAQCGHYTQLVWQDSLLVGCGQTLCRPLRLPNGSTLIDLANHVVCRYAAAGNIAGMPPYETDGVEQDRLPTYSELDGLLNLPNVLIWDSEDVVTPVQARLTLVDSTPVVFAVDSLDGAPYLDGTHTPSFDVESRRLFLAPVDTLLDGAWSRHSAVLEQVPGSSAPLLLELKSFR